VDKPREGKFIQSLERNKEFIEYYCRHLV